ncbi:MAG TPA: hypothetical protein VJ890_24910 [Vineibacter sp.]|nr:hypothetical protein [Vineibacter sp.]
MDLIEACQLVQAWGRQHEAAMTIARAVADKAALANELREIESRADSALRGEAEALARVAAAEAELALKRAALAAEIETKQAAASGEIAAIRAQAEREAAALIQMAHAQADDIIASARTTAGILKTRQAESEAAAAEAETRLTALHAEIDTATIRRDTIRAAIRAATEA